MASKKIKKGKGWNIVFSARFAIFFLWAFFCMSKPYFWKREKMSGAKKSQNRAYKNAQNFVYASNFLLLFCFGLFAFLFGFVVLGFLPNLFVQKFLQGSSQLLQNFVIGLLRFAAVYLCFAILRLSPFMHSLLRFNFAGQQLLSEKNKPSALNFLNFVVNVCLISTFVISFIAINVSWAADFFINLALLLLIESVVYEILFLIQKKQSKSCGRFCFYHSLACLSQTKHNANRGWQNGANRT